MNINNTSYSYATTNYNVTSTPQNPEYAEALQHTPLSCRFLLSSRSVDISVINTPNATAQQVLTASQSINTFQNNENLNISIAKYTSRTFTHTEKDLADDDTISLVYLRQLGFTDAEAPHALNLQRRGFNNMLMKTPTISADSQINNMSEEAIDAFLDFWGFQNIAPDEKKLVARMQLLTICELLKDVINHLDANRFYTSTTKSWILNNNFTFFDLCHDVDILLTTQVMVAYLLNQTSLRRQGVSEDQVICQAEHNLRRLQESMPPAT